MELGLSQRRVLICGDGDIAVACRAAFTAEGATITDENSTADIIVAIEPRFASAGDSALDEAQLLNGWRFIEDTVALYQHSLANMKAHNWGRLIYIGSLHAKEILDQSEHLSRTIGLSALGLQKTLAGELGPFGITSNAILWDPRYVSGTTRDSGLLAIGAATAFLASDAAAYLTGITMNIDHAQSAGVF